MDLRFPSWIMCVKNLTCILKKKTPVFFRGLKGRQLHIIYRKAVY